jgi:hypothetical protein
MYQIIPEALCLVFPAQSTCGKSKVVIHSYRFAPWVHNPACVVARTRVGKVHTFACKDEDLFCLLTGVAQLQNHIKILRNMMNCI